MKKWKIILSVVVLLLAAGAGTLYYFLNIKDYQTADAKVDEIVKNDFKVKLPSEDVSEDGSEDGSEDESGAEVTEQSSNLTADASGTAAPADSAAGTTQSQSTNKNSGQVKKPSVVKLTAGAILEKYQPAFHDLQAQADGKLNALLSYAFSEYQTKKSNGDEISYFYFYSKYNGAAKKLEASTDQSFDYIYNALVKELEKNGYSSNEAKSIKDHYQNLKKQRRSALMDKAVAYLK
ncbi:hypothetical protein QNH39_27500 [Neobacillus novalis]|uniref:Uncharacterized protein n=1 Tax=Neobacillus novalis TaxID=220687 RepID=A0AA95MM68_9BACI|nr:hypothetical protein [Neobacillus novalis]WHY86266.1 hypothetical protein QNH39_27500 [Neobacillus novalis]